MGHHRAKPGVLRSDRGRGALPDAKALWPSPSSKAGMLLGVQEGCPSFWGIPSPALESGVRQHPANVRSELLLEGGKAGMAEGKILVKVCELFWGSGGGVAAATLTCPTAPTGIKPPVPCPGAWTGGFIPQETPEGMEHQPGEGQPALRALSLFWRGARSGLGKAGSGRHPPLGAGPGMNILAKR